MTEDTRKPVQPYKASPAWRRIVAGFLTALTIAFSAYYLMNFSSSLQTGGSAFGFVWFLGVLPAFLSALICYVGDPRRTQGDGFYATVPVVLIGLVCLGSIFILREGVVCLVMLAPVWLVFGLIGAFTMQKLRKRAIDPGVFRASLLLLPLLAGMIEARIPVPVETFTVSRSIVIHAVPDAVWPSAVSNENIAPDEGRWTFSQNVLGLPRPRAATIDRAGVGAIRTAYWGKHIRFDEIVTGWQPGKRLAWNFRFTDRSLQTYTDRHISPDGPMLKIASGEYVLEPLPAGTTRLTLRTRYIARTHVNLYAALWGELFLGDVQNNVLRVVKDRAEKRRASRRP
jgi:hypothetical protein